MDVCVCVRARGGRGTHALERACVRCRHAGTRFQHQCRRHDTTPPRDIRTHLGENILDGVQTQLVCFVRHCTCTGEREIPLLPRVTIAYRFASQRGQAQAQPGLNGALPRLIDPTIHLYPASRACASAHRAGLTFCANARKTTDDLSDRLSHPLLRRPRAAAPRVYRCRQSQPSLCFAFAHLLPHLSLSFRADTPGCRTQESLHKAQKPPRAFRNRCDGFIVRYSAGEK